MQFLSYGSQLRNLFKIADEYPNCALINAHAACLHMAYEGAEGWKSARPYLDQMRKARQNETLTEREEVFCDQTEAWVVRDFHKALTLLDQLTVRWPADLCAIKWGQYHAFNLGDQDALLRLGQRAIIVHENTPYAHGLIAFALEQDHQLEAAEDHGKYAVEIAIDDAWAHHAVAHVLETRGRISDGIRWMDHCAHTWEKKGVFIRDHNWWHASLFHIANDDISSALEIYDKRLWGNWPEFPQEQIGAISSLWRLEMIGTDIQDRWSPVVEQVREHAGDHIFPFHDVHYAFALGRAGKENEATQFLKSMSDHADSLSGPAHHTWKNVCLPIAKALNAFTQKDFEDTIAHMGPALSELQYIGGSHAQRQVFLDTYETARAHLNGNFDRNPIYEKVSKLKFWQ